MLLVSLAALASAQPPELTEGLLKDREALLALRDSCTNYGQSKMAGWRPSGGHPGPHLAGA